MNTTTAQPAAQSVANTIAQQLGGRTIFMLGASKRGSCIGLPDGLMLKIRGSRKVNTIRISLAADDTYTVEFIKATMGRLNARTGDWTPPSAVTVARHEGVYVDRLHRLIEAETGLATSL